MRQGRQRADAHASVNRIVVAARAIFSTKGASATLTEIARRAGVGAATLYRHFPNRQVLAQAVYENVFSSEIEPLIAKFSESDAVRAELLDVTERLADVLHQYRELISSLDNITRTTTALLSRSGDTFETMIRRAQAAGNLRPDISASDVPNLLAMVTTALAAVDLDGPTRRRYLSLLLDGLNPDHASPLPGPTQPSRNIVDSTASSTTQ